MASTTQSPDSNQVTAELSNVLRTAKEQDRLITESQAILADLQGDFDAEG